MYLLKIKTWDGKNIFEKYFTSKRKIEKEIDRYINENVDVPVLWEWSYEEDSSHILWRRKFFGRITDFNGKDILLI